jgi:hypothetical protein
LITGNRGDNKFLDGFDPYVVRPLLIRAGQQKQIKVTLTPLLKNIKKVEMDRLYGAKLVVQAWVNPGELLIDRTVYIGRYVDATDADHRDGKLSMAPTAIGHHQFPAIVRSRVFQTRGVELAARIAVGSQDKPFFVSANTINFWPTERGAKTSATLEFVSPGNSVLGTMEVEGEPRLQEFHVDGAKIREVLASAAAGQISGVTAEQRTFLNAPGALDRIVQRTLQDVDGLLGPFASGVSRLSASSPGGDNARTFGKSRFLLGRNGRMLHSSFGWASDWRTSDHRTIEPDAKDQPCGSGLSPRAIDEYASG